MVSSTGVAFERPPQVSLTGVAFSVHEFFGYSVERFNKVTNPMFVPNAISIVFCRFLRTISAFCDATLTLWTADLLIKVLAHIF